jgi:GNAT superfamily N-acetyltransferase
VIRPLDREDADALADLMARCSPTTRRQRFHGVVTAIPPAYLARCLSGEHDALVAVVAGVVVGMASMGPVFEEPAVHEVAVLVEDRWQGEGVGRALVLGLFARTRVATVRMELCRSPLVDHVRATLPVVRRWQFGCDTVFDVDVAAVRRAAREPARRPPSSAGRRRVAAVPT